MTTDLRSTTRAFAQTFYKKLTGKHLLAKSTHHYSLVEGIHCHGVACYSIGAHAGVTNIAKSYLLPVHEVGMLMAAAGLDSNSTLIMLMQTPALLIQATHIKLIVTYHEQKELYESAGWRYTGQSHANPRFISPEGHLYDQRNVMHHAKKHGISYTQERDRMLQSGWTQQTAAPRARLVYLPNSAEESLVKMVSQREVSYDS